MTTPAPNAGKRLVPVLMVLLFFGPLAIAILMYYVGGEQWRPSGSVAHGVLLPQPKTLPAGALVLADGATAEFSGTWSLLYVGRGDCGDTCKETLYRTRQVRRALGKEMSRVQRFFVATGGSPNPEFLAADHPGILVLAEGLASRDAVLATLGPFAEGEVFIADPRGNLVLRFPAGTSMKDMHEDLKLLLKASQIG